MNNEEKKEKAIVFFKDLVKDLKKILKGMPDGCIGAIACQNEIDYVETAIEALEQKPKIGRWIGGKTRMDGFTCSECDKQYIVYRIAYNYCPNCGADMRDTVFSCARGNLKTNDFIQRCADLLDELDAESEDEK